MSPTNFPPLWRQSCFFNLQMTLGKKLTFRTCSQSKIMLTAVWSALSLSHLESIHVKIPFEDPSKLFFGVFTQSFFFLSVNSISADLSVHIAFATPRIEGIIAIKKSFFTKSCEHSSKWFSTWIGSYQSKHFIRRCKGEMPNSKLASWVGKIPSFSPIFSGLTPHIGQLLLQSEKCSCHIDLVCPSMRVRNTWKSIWMSVSAILYGSRFSISLFMRSRSALEFAWVSGSKANLWKSVSVLKSILCTT